MASVVLEQLWEKWRVLLEKIAPYSYALVLLVLYSLFINYQFGHRTYWRSKTNMKSVLHGAASQALFFKSYLPSSQARSTTSSRMQLLEHDVALEILSYLSPSDLYSIMPVSRTMNSTCRSDFLWENLANAHLRTLHNLRRQFQLSISLARFDLPPHQAYFLFCRLSMMSLATSYNDLCTIIRGDVYDLTEFKDSHPGGEHILADCKGRDATFEFNLANHSYLALQQAKKYLLVSHRQVYGRAGLPAATQQHLKQLRHLVKGLKNAR